MTAKSFLISLILSVILIGCDGQPQGVPSKGKMKRILYDYHKAQAMVGSTDQGEYINSEKLLLSVLDKHGIDSEMFDSAMVWYCENPEILQSIYQDIEKQLKAEDEELQAKVGSSEMTSIYSEGDTTNIWTGASLMLLRPQPLLCLERFTLKADTSYHRDDHFILNADIKFIKEDRSASSTLYMALTLKTKDGKTYSQTCQPRGNSIQRLDISQESDQDISEISGFFYYKGDPKATKSLCAINGISLIRMHVKEVAETDTIATDSINTDSVINDSQPRQEESPTIPSVQLSDSAPSGSTVQPRKPIDRKNEVKDINIRRAPDVKPTVPTQRRQSIQQGRQNQQNQQRPQPGRRTSPSPRRN